LRSLSSGRPLQAGPVGNPTSPRAAGKGNRIFSKPDRVKQDNDAIVAAFRERLKKVAGFNFVPEPLPMKNTNNAVIYYLFLASAKPVAEKIIEEIFSKYR